MAFGEMEFHLDPSATDDLENSDEMTELMQYVGDQVADTAEPLAPKATGAGARSIHAVVDHDAEGIHADVSWSKHEFHIGFAEVGTEDQPARPFLRPSLGSTHI